MDETEHTEAAVQVEQVEAKKEPRALSAVQLEYKELCARIGEEYYKKKFIDQELVKYVEMISALHKEVEEIRPQSVGENHEG
jgi:hypothetical protein